MGIFGFVSYMFSYRRRVYALRRKYDRVRENADKQHASKRIEVLRILDQLEPTLVTLEEQDISGYDKSRFFGFVEQGIHNAENVMKQRQTAQKKFSNAGK